MTNPQPISRRRSVLGALLLSVALLASQAMGAVAQDATPAATPSTTPTEAALETVPCDRYVLPDPLIDGENVECGYLTVPAFHGESGSPTFRLHTIRLFATGPDPVDEPLIYLAGGPGQAGASQLSAFLPGEDPSLSASARLVERQDVILLDQRGTGASEPSLACPGEVTPGLLPSGADSEAGSPAATPAEPAPFEPPDVAQTIEANTACLTDFQASGLDLTAFTTEQNAADVAALIGALGTGQADLYGVSYGTYLGGRVITRYPDLVRSAVLTSIVPPGSDTFVAQIEAFDRALTNVFDACEADIACNETNPTLEANFQAVHDRLAAEPVTVETQDLQTGQPFSLVVDGNVFVSVIYQLLYIGAPSVVPSLVSSVAAGSDEVLSRLGGLVSGVGGISTGMRIAVGCQDLYPSSSEATFEAAISREDLRPAVTDVLREGEGASLLTTCQALGFTEDASANEPVDSDVPALLVSGENDPITPPENAEVVLAGLESGQAVEIPTIGHDPVSAAGECGVDIMAGFLANPVAEVDASCTEGIVIDFTPEEPSGTATPAA